LTDIKNVRELMRKRLDQPVYNPRPGSPLGSVTTDEKKPSDAFIDENLPPSEIEVLEEKQQKFEENDGEQMINSVLENFQKRKKMFDPSQYITGDMITSRTAPTTRRYKE
jgi:hypothetical protein